MSCTSSDELELDQADDGPIAPEETTDEPGPEIAAAQAAGCSFIPKIIVYTPGFNSLAPEIAAQMDTVGARCARYYFMLPALAEPATCDDTDGDGTLDCLKIRARATAAALRAKSPHGNFHAMAEFHWHHWAAWIARSPGTRTWTSAGQAFRRDMADAGFDVALGDTWVINEMYSGVRRGDPGARANFVAAIAALDAGDPAYVSPMTGMSAGRRRGVVLNVGLGQQATFLTVYKEKLQSWLRDVPFWQAMKSHVVYFAQEVYPTPRVVCQPSATLASRAAAVNAFSMHTARLGFAADGTGAEQATAVARQFFDATYVPLLGGVWPSDLYGNTLGLSATQMMKFVSLQIYATRLWAAHHPYPDARLGIAWRADSSAEENAQVTTRAASAILNAYSDTGSRAARACSPDGDDTWCRCSITGAKFNPSWASAFATW